MNNFIYDDLHNNVQHVHVYLPNGMNEQCVRCGKAKNEQKIIAYCHTCDKELLTRYARTNHRQKGHVIKLIRNKKFIGSQESYERILVCTACKKTTILLVSGKCRNCIKSKHRAKL